MQLDGKVSAVIEKRKTDLEELKYKIQSLHQYIDKKMEQKELQRKKIQNVHPQHPSFPKQI